MRFRGVKLKLQSTREGFNQRKPLFKIFFKQKALAKVFESWESV